MEIREIRSGETEFLSDMLYEAIFIPKGQEALPRDVIKGHSLSKYVTNWGKDKFDIALVVETDNQLVAAIWGRIFTKENKGYGYVNDNTPELSIAVKTEYRNMGLGTKLINTITSRYKEIGVEHLCLSVDKANNALNLYKRIGYVTVQETETSYTMQKRIT